MHFEISRSFNGRLTPAQRHSSLFREEPVVCGKVLRRGTKPLTITEQQFFGSETQLKRLHKAGSIEIVCVREGVRIDLRSPESRLCDAIRCCMDSPGDRTVKSEELSPETGEEDSSTPPVDPATLTPALVPDEE